MLNKDLIRKSVHPFVAAAFVEAVDELELSHPQIDAIKKNEIKKKEIVEAREAPAHEK